MVIAVITVFHKERFRVDDWKRYYAEYREDVSLHVIVNNGDPEDDSYLQESFPSSKILFCPSSSLMVAYNQGLREVLAHPEVDAVAQVGNDIRIEAGGLKALYDYLFSQDGLAMVAPVLLRKDSDVVDCSDAGWICATWISSTWMQAPTWTGRRPPTGWSQACPAGCSWLVGTGMKRSVSRTRTL